MSNSIDHSKLIFNQQQLLLLENVFGNNHALANSIQPGVDRDTLLYKAGQQAVIAYIREHLATGIR